MFSPTRSRRSAGSGWRSIVAELDAHGYTVVPPEVAALKGFIEELREAILDVAGERGGVRPDFATGESHRDLPSPAGQHMYNMLLQGKPFEKALMNEVALALITYLLGESCLISSMTSMVKGPGKLKLDLHSDVLMIPPPFPTYATGANATWAASDYSAANGSTWFWPGSHKLCRQPTPEEKEDTSALVPVETPAGSLLVWHSNTWHGAAPRTAPGLRVNLIMFFARPFMLQQEPYRTAVPDAVVARNAPRFARLIGRELPFPFGVEGPDRVQMGHYNAATRSQWG